MALHAPIFFAAWSEPDIARQEATFGRVVLSGADLASYCVWIETLADDRRLAWEMALDLLEETGDRSGLVRLQVELESSAPLPEPLVQWLTAA
jgi:hypothetical protein